MEAGTMTAPVMAAWGRARFAKVEQAGDCEAGVWDRTAGAPASTQMPANASQARGLMTASHCSYGPMLRFRPALANQGFRLAPARCATADKVVWAAFSPRRKSLSS